MKMTKDRSTSLPKFWWYLFFFGLIIVPAAELSEESTPKSFQEQSSVSCNQSISTDLPINSIKISQLSKILQRNVCPFADMCLQITTGNVSDYAQLYYSNARKTILQGYLICGGDGVSVTGTTPSFEEFYVTLISSRPMNNSRFFVNGNGSASIVSLRNDVSFDIDYSYQEHANTFYSQEKNVDLRGDRIKFNDDYPMLPRQGYELNIIAFYDNNFKTACTKTSKTPDDVIEQIFSHVRNFFEHESLPTTFHIKPNKIIYRSGVIWNNAKENATVTSLKKQDLLNHENADIFVYLGLRNTDDYTYGKVSKVGRCFSNNQTCCGVCSELKYEKSLVVECNINNLPETAYIITHEIGHLLGLKHDFLEKTETDPLVRPKFSYVRVNPCTNVNGIMDYVNTKNNNLKWTDCSIEHLRIYHQQVKEISNRNSFCLTQYSHVTTVKLIPGEPLDLTCDIRKCNKAGIDYVKWFLKSTEYIGSYDPSFDRSNVKSNYSNNMSIIYEEENVILRISTYTSAIQKAYCVIDAHAPNPFCETKQTFDIKGPGI